MNRFNRFVLCDQPFAIVDEESNDIEPSLEFSLQPLLNEIDQLNYYIREAKQHCQKSSQHHLTIDESAAIYLYCHEWSQNSLHHALNEALQSGDPAKMKPWLHFWHLFNHALEKLPTLQRTLWRGLPEEMAITLDPSTDIVCWNVISCCLSEETMKSQLHQDSILCLVEALHAKDIRPYTAERAIDEVLLLSGTRLRVQHAFAAGQILRLVQIDPIHADPFSNDTNSENNLGNSDVGSHADRRLVSKETRQYRQQRSYSSIGTTDSEIYSTITFANGDQYQVIYGHDQKQSFGRYTNINGDTYTGVDADQRATGEGICVFPNGHRFIGTFEQGLRHGHGILYHTNGTILVGRWIQDQMVEKNLQLQNTAGQYEWRDQHYPNRWYGAYHDDQGNQYVGGMMDGQPNGVGIRIWPDNSRYEGSFKNDQKDGYGIYYYSDRDKYMGQWQNDEIHGHGILRWQSGTLYQGSFVQGKRHGEGTLILPDQQIRRGLWKNDLYIA